MFELLPPPFRSCFAKLIADRFVLLRRAAVRPQIPGQQQPRVVFLGEPPQIGKQLGIRLLGAVEIFEPAELHFHLELVEKIANHLHVVAFVRRRAGLAIGHGKLWLLSTGASSQKNKASNGPPTDMRPRLLASPIITTRPGGSPPNDQRKAHDQAAIRSERTAALAVISTFIAARRPWMLFRRL